MHNWPTKKLGEVAEIHYGKGLAKSERVENGKYFAYGSNGPVYKTNKILVNYPTIIIGRKGAVGVLYITQNPSWPIDTTFYVEIKDSKLVSLEFMYFLLRTKKLSSLAIVTAVPGININSLYNLKISLPSLLIQHQIVERLDAIKKAQELNDKQIALAEELFQSLLNKELDSKGTDRKINKLEEVAEIIMGQSPPSSTYNTERNGLPFLQGKFEFGEIYPIPIKFCSRPLRIAKKNDVLLSVRAPVGPVNLAPSECCIGRGLSAIRAKAEKLDQLFLFYFMKLNEERMSLLGCGSTFNAIGRDHIEKIKISLPPLQTQRQIVKKLQAVQDYKKKLLEQKQKLQELFLSCLDKAMKGELVS